MRWLALTLSLLLAAPAVAGDEEDIAAVIGAQIEAFQKDDMEEAFTYASPGIRSMFRTPDNFGRMVKGGYPMIHRPASWQVVELVREEGGLVQKVLFTDAKGALYEADYTMVQIDGAWRIAGVSLRKLPGTLS